jgi:hypothetical protein
MRARAQQIASVLQHLQPLYFTIIAVTGASVKSSASRARVLLDSAVFNMLHVEWL